MLPVKSVLLLIFYCATTYGQFYTNCDDNPCANGKCTDLYRKTAYTCDCDPNWTGENCDTRIDKESDGAIVQDQSFDTNDIQDDKKKDFFDTFEKETKNKESACDGKCKNGGLCDSRTQRCLCNVRFTGEFCQYNNNNVEIHNDLNECEEKCVNKDIESGNTCDYKESDSQKSCQCQMFKINKEHGYCQPIFDNYKLCQDDCEANTNFAMNETRICFYYLLTKVEGCGCTDSDEKCKAMIFDLKLMNVFMNSAVSIGVFIFVLIILSISFKAIMKSCINKIFKTSNPIETVNQANANIELVERQSLDSIDENSIEEVTSLMKSDVNQSLETNSDESSTH